MLPKNFSITCDTFWWTWPRRQPLKVQPTFYFSTRKLTWTSEGNLFNWTLKLSPTLTLSSNRHLIDNFSQETHHLIGCFDTFWIKFYSLFGKSSPRISMWKAQIKMSHRRYLQLMIMYWCKWFPRINSPWHQVDSSPHEPHIDPLA